MDDPDDLSAQDVAELLVALGWPIAPCGPDMEAWEIGTGIFTDQELLEFAAWAGVVTAAKPSPRSRAVTP